MLEVLLAPMELSMVHDFLIQIGLHQGLVLSSLLFIIVLEALSIECRLGCPEELLYGDEHWKRCSVKH